MSHTQRSAVIPARFRPEERKQVQLAAAIHGQSVSSLVRVAVMAETERILDRTGQRRDAR